MKKLLLLIIVVLISIYCLACGKVHDAPSRLRIISLGITDGEEKNQDSVSWSSGVDMTGEYCYDPDDPDDCTPEPFHDSYVNMIVRNYFKFNVTLTHCYYVIKNYYGNGNDYISPNLGLMGNTFLQGNNNTDTTNQDTNTNNTSQVKTYALFLPAANGEKQFPGGKDIVDNRGVFNVVFYIYGRADNGDEIEARSMTSISFNDYNQCDNGKNPTRGC